MRPMHRSANGWRERLGIRFKGDVAMTAFGTNSIKLAACCCAMAASACGFAQTYPSKPVRIVIGFAAGSSSDVTARVLGPKLNELWGQSVVVDNRPGAGGNIAAEHVANAAPDGYTLLFPSSSIAIAQSYYRKLQYNAVKDFAPVTQVTAMPNILCVNAVLPVKSVKELIALAKQRPNELLFSSAGNGSSDHMGAELFAYMAGLKLTHVPYKGGPQALSDVIAGQVALIITGLPVALPQAKAGKVRALAV